MEIHFYESTKYFSMPIYTAEGCEYCLDWKRTKEAIEKQVGEIHTLQMCLLSTTLLHEGYKVFIHQDNGVMYEITLQTKNNHGNRTVRTCQNMYAMWTNNIFRE